MKRTALALLFGLAVLTSACDGRGGSSDRCPTGYHGDGTLVYEHDCEVQQMLDAQQADFDRAYEDHLDDLDDQAERDAEQYRDYQNDY